MRCNECEIIPLIEIKNPTEYGLALNSIQNMLESDKIEMIYQTCPVTQAIKADGTFFSARIFHQFKCKKCGTIYGLLCSPKTGGGEIKINAKPFTPNEYTTKDEK